MCYCTLAALPCETPGFGIAAVMRNQHRVFQQPARSNTKLPLKTLLTSHLHLVIAAAVESYTLVTRTTLPFAVSLVVKACWLWEFHLRAEEATFGARILIQWCYHLAVAFALLPATGAAIKLAGGFTNTTPFADAIAKVTSLDGYVALASAVRGGDWAFRALRAQNTTDTKWGVFLAVCAGIEVSALRKCRERSIDIKCDVPPLPVGPLKRLRMLRRHVRNEAIAPHSSCDTQTDVATIACIAGLIALIDAVARFVRSGRGAPRRATHLMVRVAANPLLPFLGVAARWLDADVVRPFSLLRIAVGLDALRSAAAAAWRGDAAGALQPPPPSTPPGSPERRRTTEDRIRHGVDIQHRSSAGGIYGDVGRSPPRSPRRKLVL